MVNTDDLISLSWEQKQKFRSAIRHGYFDNYEDNPRAWKHTLVGSLLWRYPERSATLIRLRNVIGHEPTWDDITDDVLRDFVDDASETMAASSVRTICDQLKAVLNANRRKIPSEDYREILSVKGCVSQHIYLTREEMQRIFDYRPRSEVERFVRRNFLVEFLTGARRCDAERLTTHNCDIETGMLTYVPKKTPGIRVTVPVDERLGLRTLLAERYHFSICRSSFNDCIRGICKRCGIDTVCTLQQRGTTVTAPKWQLVASHTARRSFATNMYLAGIALEDIAMLMGHGKNIDTTKNYICADRQVSSNVMAYFKPQYITDL